MGSVRQMPGRTEWLPPWLFQHHDLIQALEGAKKVKKDALTNTLNYIHFTGGFLYALLRDNRFGEIILLRALPDPSLGQNLTCRWAEQESVAFGLEHYTLLYLIVDDGRSLILVPAEAQEISTSGVTIQLPECGYSVGQRGSRRFCCEGIGAELIQKGFLAKGRLVDSAHRVFACACGRSLSVPSDGSITASPSRFS